MNNDTNDKMTYETELQPEEAQENASSERVSRFKKRTRKKRKKKHYALKFLILIAVCVATYFFLHSAVFTVKNITLEKNNRFGLKYIQELAGLEKGVNLYDVKIKASEDKLEENPFIREAEISRKLPDTLNISLDLREPAAVILHNKKYVMIDAEGTVLAIREQLPRFTLLSGLTVKEAKEGEIIQIKEAKKYQEYMDMIQLMNESDLYFRQMVLTDDGIKLYVKKNLYCTGEKANVVAGMKDGNLKAVLYNLLQKKVQKGVVTVGDDQYYSFSKKVK